MGDVEQIAGAVVTVVVLLDIPMKALQASGARVDVLSLRHGSIRGVNLHEPASRVHVDKTIRAGRSPRWSWQQGGAGETAKPPR